MNRNLRDIFSRRFDGKPVNQIHVPGSNSPIELSQFGGMIHTFGENNSNRMDIFVRSLKNQSRFYQNEPTTLE